MFAFDSLSRADRNRSPSPAAEANSYSKGGNNRESRSASRVTRQVEGLGPGEGVTTNDTVTAKASRVTTQMDSTSPILPVTEGAH